MKRIVGVRFKKACKIYDFDCGAFVLNKGDHVIVETEDGLVFGTVIIPPIIKEESELQRPLKKVFRIATAQDIEELKNNKELEKRAFEYCKQCIKDLNLKMNLFAVESTFDTNKLTFFFTAEGRIDFRDLVKLLVKELHTRIEMRQVGIRNQAKMCGGIGRCGQELCCASFLEKFEPVSIRMAKEQNLSLNPTKISGVCGRLMCCLTYEYETYKELRVNFPPIGSIVETTIGQGKVTRQNVICNRVAIMPESGHEVEVELSSIIKSISQPELPVEDNTIEDNLPEMEDDAELLVSEEEEEPL